MPSQQSLRNLTNYSLARRTRTHCDRGHNDWKVCTDGRRRCMTCRRNARSKPKIKREPLFGLRDIEITIIREMSYGFNVKQTSARHNYSEQAIKSLRTKVRRKLRAYDNAEAVAIAFRHQLIQ